MATINDARLAITHDHPRKMATCVVTARLGFTPYEMNEMREGLKFKLKCELWGDDSGLTGSDDKLYTYTPVKYFPDPNPTPSETVTFTVQVGEGVLDEDGFLGGYVDEVYGKLTLTNTYTLVNVTKNTNIVHHEFRS